MLKMSVLRPGFLVSLKTTVRGGVAYTRTDTEPDHLTESGERVAVWITGRTINDPAEFEAAQVARSRARSLVTAVCSATSFGLLCPASQEYTLGAAINAAREVADAFNAGAARSHVEVYALIGRVAQDDAEAARAIAAECRELLEAMLSGIKQAQPEAIREAANKARALGQMLSADVAGKVSDAIMQARSAAREITKRVEKAGEAAAGVVAECGVRKIETARFAFLDLEPGGEVAESAPGARGGIELAPVVESAPVFAAGGAGQPQLDL